MTDATPFPTCADDRRRAAVQNGIEDVELVYVPEPAVAGSIAHLHVFFFHGVPAALSLSPLPMRIAGGVRVLGPSIVLGAPSIVSTGTRSYLDIPLDRWGDHSVYELVCDLPDADTTLDLTYRRAQFRFTVDCDQDVDCEPPPAPPAPLGPEPPIDGLARDYGMLRRALLDFVPTRVPDFAETSEADVIVTIAEAFAFAGDRLAYMQDAIAQERTFATARLRTSVKRHARLVDYRLLDAIAAMTFLQFAPRVGQRTIPARTQVGTDESDPGAVETFETLDQIVADNLWNPPVLVSGNVVGGIALYTWLDALCCIAAGATVFDLDVDVLPADVPALLLIEEVRAPFPQADGEVLFRTLPDPTHRQVVRVVRAEHLVDPANGGRPLTRVHVDPRDALRFDLCVNDSSGAPNAVVSANLVRAVAALTVANDPVDLRKPPVRLSGVPLAVLPADVDATLFGDGAATRDVRSSVELSVDLDDGAGPEVWQEVETLFDSRPSDRHFVADIENDGSGTLRFGDGELGAPFPRDGIAALRYRTGGGALGNVGHDTLTRIAGPLAANVTARNPLQARGGRDPEPVADARRDAPRAYSAVQYRAVTAADYVVAAKRVPGVWNAAATFRYTGSWLTVFVGIDPTGRETLDDATLRAVRAQLDACRQAGYDLEIRPPQYIPLDVELAVCATPGHYPADVARAVEEALGSGITADGTPGFFHPNHFTFGQPLYLSRLVAAAYAVDGVRDVEVVRFQRKYGGSRGELGRGAITVGPFDIVRLDADPSRPDNGTLAVRGVTSI